MKDIRHQFIAPHKCSKWGPVTPEIEEERMAALPRLVSETVGYEVYRKGDTLTILAGSDRGKGFMQDEELTIPIEAWRRIVQDVQEAG